MKLSYLENEMEAIESFHQKTLHYALKRGAYLDVIKLYFIGRRIKKARDNLQEIKDASTKISKLKGSI